MKTFIYRLTLIIGLFIAIIPTGLIIALVATILITNDSKDSPMGSFILLSFLLALAGLSVFVGLDIIGIARRAHRDGSTWNAYMSSMRESTFFHPEQLILGKPGITSKERSRGNGFFDLFK